MKGCISRSWSCCWTNQSLKRRFGLSSGQSLISIRIKVKTDIWLNGSLILDLILLLHKCHLLWPWTIPNFSKVYACLSRQTHLVQELVKQFPLMGYEINFPFHPKTFSKWGIRFFYLSMIIDNAIHIIHGIGTLTLFRIPYFYLIALIYFLFSE